LLLASPTLTTASTTATAAAAATPALELTVEGVRLYTPDKKGAAAVATDAVAAPAPSLGEGAREWFLRCVAAAGEGAQDPVETQVELRTILPRSILQQVGPGSCSVWQLFATS
jgi:hypothetical protein